MLPELDMKHAILVVQYAAAWKDDLLKFLQLNKNDATICAVADTQISMYLYGGIRL